MEEERGKKGMKRENDKRRKKSKWEGKKDRKGRQDS